jgi:glucose-1-phosphate thymidylyltransferase
MKALVLCAGRGTRLRPLTHTRAKAAIPVAGRPVLSHILDYLWLHGFNEVGVVISPRQRELKSLPLLHSNQRVTFLVQKRQLGIAHAVQTAQTYLGGDPFLLYLGDNLTNEDLFPALERFQTEQPEALLAVRIVANPSEFGVAEVVAGRVVGVVEKPIGPVSNLAIAGIYLFQPSIHEAIGAIQPGRRGELEITDAIAQLLANGRPVIAHAMSGWWQDMGTPEGILTANSLLLDTIQTQIDPSASLIDVTIEGRVVIERGAQLRHVKLRGPILIGCNCQLEDAYIGPYTSVGDEVRITSASVEHSILLPGCRVEGPPFHLDDCLLGRRAVVEVRAGRTVTLWLGDDGRLQIPRDRR